MPLSSPQSERAKRWWPIQKCRMVGDRVALQRNWGDKMVTNVSWDICPGFTKKRREAFFLTLTLTRACQLTHQESKVILRLRIVGTWKECGSLRETARRLSISRNTVRKWVRRYQESGEAGLVDRSRRPHHSPPQHPTGGGQEMHRP